MDETSSSLRDHSCGVTKRARFDRVRAVKHAAAGRIRIHVICLCAALFLVLASHAEEEAERHADVLVNAESDEAEHDQFTEMGEYGQPAWAERNRASSTTSVYV